VTIVIGVLILLGQLALAFASSSFLWSLFLGLVQIAF
jgi:hypothetical protein